MLYDFIMKVPVSKSKYILEFSRERDEQEAETITLSWKCDKSTNRISTVECDHQAISNFKTNDKYCEKAH
jgi:hypothetical protein